PALSTPSLHDALPISKRNQDLVARQTAVFSDQVRPALDEAGIRFVRWVDLTAEDRARLSRYFSDNIFPLLTPLAVDPAHPFPYRSEEHTSELQSRENL